MVAGRRCLAVVLALAVVAAMGTAWAQESRSHRAVAARVSAAPPGAARTFSPAKTDRSGAIRASGSVTAAGVTETFPADPKAEAFDFYSAVQPLTLALTHETDPAVYHIEDHVYTVWLERGEDAVFVIDGPDTPSVDLDLYVYPPGTTDFSDPAGINFPDTGSDEGIQIDDVISEGYWFVRVNSKAGTGGQDFYDFYWGFESPDDEIPGVPLAGPVTSTRIDEHSDSDDVFSMWLAQGESVSIRADYPLRGHWTLEVGPELYLFGPGSTSIWTDEALAVSTSGDSFQHRLLNYTAPVSGVYYIDVYQPLMSTSLNHADFVTLTVKRSSPVYRFYNKKSSTHFYTPSAEEAEMVKVKWPTVFDYEGIAYVYDSGRATKPLWRFYNKANGSHFYTASDDEKDAILAKWPNIFSLDGPTYPVCPAQVAGSSPVWRFYNKANGSHFYTASAEERDMVQARWGNVYSLDGPAFYLPQ
jgi:hypothetical protein